MAIQVIRPTDQVGCTRICGACREKFEDPSYGGAPDRPAERCPFCGNTDTPPYTLGDLMHDFGRAEALAKEAQDELRAERSKSATAAELLAAMREKFRDTNDAVRGLERIIRSRKGVDALDLGTEVKILETGVVAKVAGVFIDRGGVKYRCRWWSARGDLKEELLDQLEVEELKDVLPLPEDNEELKLPAGFPFGKPYPKPTPEE